MFIRRMLAGMMLAVASVLVLVSPGQAQWQVPLDALPIGKGTGTGFATGPKIYYVTAKGAKCDGATDDTSALQALGATVSAAGGGTIVFPVGATCLIYNSGQSLASPLFNFTSGAAKYIKIEGNGSTLSVAATFTTADTLVIVNTIQNKNIWVDGLNVTQAVPIVHGGVPYGTVLLSAANNSGVPANDNFDITVSNSSITGGQSLFSASNATNAFIYNSRSIASFYGVVGLDGMKGLTVRGFYASGLYRDLFLKGVTNWDVSITSINPVSNSVLLSADANNAVLGDGKLNYRVLARTAGAQPTSYITIGPGSTITGATFRNIDVTLDVDLSGDAATVPVIQFIKSTTSSLTSTFENLRFGGKISGAVASAGKIIDLFTVADAPWNTETARNISLENLLVTGSTTPTFYVDYAPFPTLVGGHFSLRNFVFPGNYTDFNATNIVGIRFSANVSFANSTPAIYPTWGGTGISQPTIHTIPVAQGSAAFNLLTLTDGQIIVGATGADPTVRTMGGNCTLSATGVITCGSAGLTVGTSTITGGTTARILYDNAGVLGEYTISGSGTVVAMATGATLTTAVAAGIWTASGTWTLPAHTLGGTISGGGNQINNVIIGTSTPLAGFFTTVGATSTINAAAASGYQLGGTTVLVVNTPYTQINAPDGVQGMLIGSAAGDPNNYYRGNSHVLTTRAGGKIISISAGGATFVGNVSTVQFSVDRNTTADTAGNQFSQISGSATVGATNKDGGLLFMSAGVSTGSGTGNITFRVYPGVAAATSDNTGISSTLSASGLAFGAGTVILKQGANGPVGTFVCTSGGTITVNNTSIAITDVIHISLNTVGGTISTNPTVNAITAATSFTAKCATSDTSTYNYHITKSAAWLLERDLDPANDNAPMWLSAAA